MQGIIVGNIADLYEVKQINSSKADIYEAKARGRFKKEEITPVVGDKVEFEITDIEKKEAVIEKIEQREIFLKRPKLANITQIVLVLSSKNPKPDLLMLDKQLAFSEFLGVQSLIVINKMDLDKENKIKEIKSIYEAIGYNVIETQANEKKGIEELKAKLKNHINAFSGNSGVGKSTLINGIFNKEITQEGEISKRNKKGKNTTTAIKLYEINENTYIADTPGFSTFSIEEIPSNELQNYFVEFKSKICNCEFVGCTHIKEENCGIKEAIKKGEINPERYERFCKIYQELKQREEKEKW